MALGDVLDTFTAPDDSPADIGWNGSTLWVVDFTDTVYEVDPCDGSTLNSFAISSPRGGPRGIEWRGSDLWVLVSAEGGPGDPAAFLRLNSSDGTILETINTIDSEALYGLTFLDATSNFWIDNQGGQVEERAIGDASLVSSFNYTVPTVYHGLTVGPEGDLWLSFDDDSSSVADRYSTSGIERMESFSLPGVQPRGFTFDGTDFWHTDIDGCGNVYRLEGPSQDVTGTLASDTQPLEASLSGEQAQTGTVASTAQPVEASLDGEQTQSGTMGASLTATQASLSGQSGTEGQIASETQPLEASLTGEQPTEGTLESALAPLTASNTGFRWLTSRPDATDVAGDWTPEPSGTLHGNTSDESDSTWAQLVAADSPSTMILELPELLLPLVPGDGKVVIRAERVDD